MKPFDLEKALAGEPVKLRNGDKAYLKYVIPDQHLRGKDDDFKLQGYVLSANGKRIETHCWNVNGKYFSDCCSSSLDVVGMWQEPRPRVQLDLPAPLENVEKGQKVYYLELGNQFSQIGEFDYNEDNPCAFQLYRNGGIFATKEDAQEWLNAMRNARK